MRYGELMRREREQARTPSRVTPERTRRVVLDTLARSGIARDGLFSPTPAAGEGHPPAGENR